MRHNFRIFYNHFYRSILFIFILSYLFCYRLIAQTHIQDTVFISPHSSINKNNIAIQDAGGFEAPKSGTLLAWPRRVALLNYTGGMPDWSNIQIYVNGLVKCQINTSKIPWDNIDYEPIDCFNSCTLESATLIFSDFMLSKNNDYSSPPDWAYPIKVNAGDILNVVFNGIYRAVPYPERYPGEYLNNNGGDVFMAGGAPDYDCWIQVWWSDGPANNANLLLKYEDIEPKIVILQPVAGAEDGHITHEPLMPTVTCQAQLQNYNGGQVTYNWIYSTGDTLLRKTLIGTLLTPLYTGIEITGETISTGSTISQWTVPFNGKFTGGKTILIVNATTSENITFSDTVYINSIIGDNPSASEVKGGLSLEQQVLVYMESRPKWKQFNDNTRDSYNVHGNPIYGPPNGFGLMQIDTPPPTESELWNWKENLNAGIKLFSEKAAMAAGYANRVRLGRTWTKDTKLRWHPYDPVPFRWYGEVSKTGKYIRQIPYYNARELKQGEELMKDSFQRYNGGVYWKWVPDIPGNSMCNGRWEKGTSSSYGNDAWKIYKEVTNGQPPASWN